LRANVANLLLAGARRARRQWPSGSHSARVERQSSGNGLWKGLPLAYAFSRIIQAQLFELSAHDPMALTGAVVILAAVAFVAGYLPARRATRVDPMLALRYE
jgi:hypothetical protein